MVYYFTSNVVDPPAFIYVGKDKVESTQLPRPPSNTPKFHADKLSSAHIYLRLPEGSDWESVPQDLLTDCAQLTKSNSIEGNKKDNINVVYTPWSNLKKDGSMAVGQVSFKDQRKVKKILVETRINAIVNRLNKTKEERFPDLAEEKEEREREIRNRENKAMLERKKEEARVAREHREKAWQKDHAYDDVFTEDALEASSNQNRDAGFYDDFL
ncbi:unnamed protein product [Tuber aestivum]|uniref:NFACT RNA-binding domain-containing protein n=1 Tax=Tuber aestivum TaxID=59557 RepID=A0A292Q3J2_9PEZI|nr:unnamed protein product [Tuber aestivum]